MPKAIDDRGWFEKHNPFATSNIAPPVSAEPIAAAPLSRAAVVQAQLGQQPGATQTPMLDPVAVTPAAGQTFAPVEVTSTPAPAAMTTAQPQQPQEPQYTEQSQTKTTQTVVSKESQAAAAKAEKEERSAIELGRTNAVARASEEATLQRERANHLYDQQKLDAMQRQDEQAAIDGEMRKERQIQDELGTMKKDPKRYYRNMDTGQRIGAAIAMIFGGIGQALTGKENAAIAVFDKAVDRDLDAQESEINLMKHRVNLQGNMVARVMQKGVSAQAARDIVRGEYEATFSARLREVAARNGTPEANQIAAQQQAALDARTAERLAKASARVVETVKARAPGGGGTQLPAGEAASLGEANSAAAAVRDLHEKWKNNASGFLGWVASKLPGTDASRYENRANVAAQIVGSYLEGGKLMEADLIRYKEMLPHAGELAETARQKMDALVSMVANRQRAQKSALAGAGFSVSGIPNAAVTFTPGGK